MKIEKLINDLKLEPHPEGGFYREVYRSCGWLISPKNNKKRNLLTDIYYLLQRGQISRFHSVVHDEVWHFYQGAPLQLLEIDNTSHQLSKILLSSNPQNLQYKHCIKGGNWQAAFTTGEYSLVGCTVAPAFDFADFQFLKDSPDYRIIMDKYTELTDLV